MKVIKFGGSSLASATQLNKVLHIVKDDPQRRIVIVSAPGKRHPDDEKVTDLLIHYAENYLSDKDVTTYQNKIIQRYKTISDELHLNGSILESIKTNILALATMNKQHPARVMDAFKASGEDNSAKLVADFFNQNELPACYVNPKDAGLIVSDQPGNAIVLESSYEKIFQLNCEKQVLVIPGFFGYSEKGDICTFSRGGSDVTGSIIAAGIHADLYENFTDVDAIYTAHPNIIKNPKEIKELTFREMRELSYSGFAVFHDEALIPTFRTGVQVVIKNTNNPTAPGTKISMTRETQNESVIGIAADTGFSSIYISKFLMNRELGFGRRVLAILESFDLNYEHMPSGIDDISIIIRENQFTEGVEEQLLKKLKTELNSDEVKITHNLSMIVVVGEGMKRQLGTAAKATQALSDAKINLEMINQGSSEVSIIFGIDSHQEKKAIQALYHAFFE